MLVDKSCRLVCRADILTVNTMSPGWYKDPARPGRLRWWDGVEWGPVSVPPPPPLEPMQMPAGFRGETPFEAQVKSRQRKRTALLLLGVILGSALLVFGGCGVLAFLGVKAASGSLDISYNSQTGLSDGNYTMDVSSAIAIGTNCSYEGTVVSDSGDTHYSVYIVGVTAKACPHETEDTSTVLFNVDNGIAEIVKVR